MYQSDASETSHGVNVAECRGRRVGRQAERARFKKGDRARESALADVGLHLDPTRQLRVESKEDTRSARGRSQAQSLGLD